MVYVMHVVADIKCPVANRMCSAVDMMHDLADTLCDAANMMHGVADMMTRWDVVGTPG